MCIRDRACIQESSLKAEEKFQPKFRNYTIYNMSCPGRRGGGVATVIHNSLPVTNVSKRELGGMEFIQTTVQLHENLTVSIVNVYIPPDVNISKENLQELIPTNKYFLILGDLNSKHPAWNDGPANTRGRIMYEWICENNMILQNSKQKTYFSASSGEGSTIDLTLVSTSLLHYISDWFIGEDLGSDHLPIFTKISHRIDTSGNSVPQMKWKLKSADWPIFRSELDNSLIAAKHESSPDLNLSEKNSHSALDVGILTNVIIEAALKSIPKIKQKQGRPMNVWWNSETAGARKERQKARRALAKQNNIENRIKYNRANALAKRENLSAKRESWKRFVGTINPNTPASTVWKNFKAISGQTYHTINCVEDDAGNILQDEKTISEHFNRTYAKKSGVKTSYPKTLSKEEQFYSCNKFHLFLHADESDAAVTSGELHLAVSELKNTAAGPDDIHNGMLRHLTEEFTQDILNLFNHIWTSGNFLGEWKTSIIIPLLKSGKQKLSTNSYRPIALTSCLGKLLERIINNRLRWRLEKNNLLDQNQFGFRPGRSTVDAILRLTEAIYAGFHNKKVTVAVMVDFEAAFDRIPPGSLILQAMKIGIKGRMLRFIDSFLQDRTIKTKINNTTSEEIKINNGVPQGSVPVSYTHLDVYKRQVYYCVE